MKLLGTILIPLIFASQNCLAAQSDNVRTVTRTSMYRITGWEHDLVNGTPNLDHFHWEPMMGRTVNTTRTTSKQANSVPLNTQPKTVCHYVKPNHLPLPTPALPRGPNEVTGALRSEKTAICLRNQVEPTLTYSTSINWVSKKSKNYTHDSATKESVYGVIRCR